MDEKRYKEFMGQVAAGARLGRLSFTYYEIFPRIKKPGLRVWVLDYYFVFS